MRLKDKVAVIAGAGRGVGRATALLFSQEGAKVFVVARQKKVGEETVSLIQSRGGESFSIAADLTQSSECDRVMRQVLKQYGKIDILHCNMGGYASVPFEDMKEKEWDDMFDINLKAKFLTVKSAVPHMIKNGSGSIILTAAVYGPIVSTKNMAHYNASKSAVVGFTKSLALELASRNIRVNCVCPGQISHQTHTKGHSTLQTHPEILRGGLPEDAAFSVLYFASPESSWVTGTTLVVDGGMSVGVHRVSPAKGKDVEAE
ncbi:MAG: SDR family oxidoreductase [Elusimicrobia bacterium]|nr:SDR family oxidoreductase [Elusimicrobiota bacterium]